MSIAGMMMIIRQDESKSVIATFLSYMSYMYSAMENVIGLHDTYYMEGLRSYQ